MAAEVLCFHVVYEGLENRLWRDMEFSSRSRLDQIGYAVLAAFDAMGSHLFEIRFRGTVFSLPDEEIPQDYHDLAETEAGDISLLPGEKMEMIYDFGTEQHFQLHFRGKRPMKRGEGRHFPYITGMEGRGIVEDISAEELAELVRQIDEKGKTNEPVYYSSDGFWTDGAPWDIRHFDLKVSNRLLKYDYESILEGYASFWE